MPEQDQPPKTPRKQPAKTAAARKAAPTKGAAKKAAPRAAATDAPTSRDSILNRIAELEERISAEPPRTALPAEQLAADAPPKPPAAKRPAVKKSPAKPVREPIQRPVKEAVARRPVSAPEPEPTPEVVVAPPAIEASPLPAVAKPARRSKPAPTPEPVVTELEGSPVFDQQAEPIISPAVTEPPPRVRRVHEVSTEHQPRSTSFLPFVVGLIVALLAVAVGLGAAAAARSQPATWSSSSVVTLSAVSPGASASAVPDGVDRYQERANGSSFTAVAAFQAGVKPRTLVKARQGTEDQVLLEAKASTEFEAANLAAAAGRALVMAVAASEALVVDAAERLSAVATPGSAPERESPRTRDVWLAGLLAALAFLLVAAMVALLVASRKIRKNLREVLGDSSLDGVTGPRSWV